MVLNNQQRFGNNIVQFVNLIPLRNQEQLISTTEV